MVALKKRYHRDYLTDLFRIAQNHLWISIEIKIVKESTNNKIQVLKWTGSICSIVCPKGKYIAPT